ncbi:MAG: hypothetical protein ACI9AD_000953 [Nitriliruptoraceae bacterium]
MNETDAIEQLATLLDRSADTGTAPDSLLSLLSLADSMRSEAQIMAPSSDFRSALRAELVASGTVQTTLLARLLAGWTVRTNAIRSSARVAVAALTASSMLGTAGVAMASQESIPGDALYAMKGWTEQVRLMLATDELAGARLHLAFAAERLEEIELGAATLSSDQIVDLLRRMDTASQAGADAMLDGAASGATTLDELRSFTVRQRSGLAGLLAHLPLLAQNSAVESLELLLRIGANATSSVALSVLDDCDCSEADAESVITSMRSRSPVFGFSEPKAQLDCDCINPPAGSFARAPRRSGSDESEPRADQTNQNDDTEPREQPFQPGNGLSNADPRTDSDDGQGSISTGLNALPLDSLGEITGVQPDTSAVNRAAEATDDGLSDG